MCNEWFAYFDSMLRVKGLRYAKQYSCIRDVLCMLYPILMQLLSELSLCVWILCKCILNLYYAYIKWKEKKLIIHSQGVRLMLSFFFPFASFFLSVSLFLVRYFLFRLFVSSHSFYQFQCSSHPRPCAYHLTFFRSFGRFVCFCLCAGVLVPAFGIFSTSLLLDITVASLVLYP